MRWNFLLLAALSLAIISNTAYANYWFQFGVRGSVSSESNQGASISIQTITPQNVSTGSPAFWVGEDLQNDAFLQVGYLVVNESGSYPAACSLSLGCTSYENINASQPEWFYEYFPSGYSGGDFLGAIGPAGSAGANGTFNTYAFYYNSNNGKWDFLFNGKTVGSVNLSSSTSGSHAPVAFGELANATNNKATIRPVIMDNLSTYSNGAFSPVPSGYSYIGYGTGSQTGISVPYGVKEVGSRVDYFQVGSNISIIPNQTQLWSLGYSLDIVSKYGNLSGTMRDMVYSKVEISAPRIVDINNNTREVFAGWEGSGLGSYSGLSNSTTISMNSNITETVEWQPQYFVSIMSSHGIAGGSGWYYPNTTVDYSINSTQIYGYGNTSRDLFEGWSNGANASKGSLKVMAPVTLSAEWQPQFLVNATAQYGNVSGSGWLPANITDVVSVSPDYIQINGTSRYAFYSWSNGEMNSSISIYLNRPYSLYGSFKKQYLYAVQAVDEAGNRLQTGGFYEDGKEVNGTVYLFAGKTYNITEIYYKGVWMDVKSSVKLNSSRSSEITLPVYNVEVVTKDIFGSPVNANVSLRFANGTVINTNTGRSGQLLVYDVPYGTATGFAKYYILTSQISAGSGMAVQLVFIDPFELLIFIPVIIIAAVIYRYSSKKLHTPRPPRTPKANDEAGFPSGAYKEG